MSDVSLRSLARRIADSDGVSLVEATARAKSWARRKAAGADGAGQVVSSAGVESG